MAPTREVLSWADFGVAVRDLAHAVYDSGYRPDLLLGIARGGLFPAGALGYALGIKNIHIMNVEFYTDVEERLPLPIVLPPVPQEVDLNEKSVLVVDDVADTGGTLKLVRDFCAGHVRDIRTVVLYEKPHSLVKCEYVWKHTDKWIAFPWSSDPPLVEGAVQDN
ncbi:MAG: phosphoribosyltransferase [Propionibacteriaceae bacterium]|jgi:hypoxanthine phosphoribosyltransferase|nr:phosphoribosyltransferase [Propionibacteriaceae bacterium]